jgi:glycerol-3-phosphate dehydrogenase
VENFFTITGGKLTTYRLMAEKTADLVCRYIGVNRPCRTRVVPLPASSDTRWTEPGLAPRLWVEENNPADLLLCECEMVPQSTVDSVTASIHTQNGHPSLKEIGLRSRMGKGPCQGTFCSQRVTAHLYDRGQYRKDQGLDHLRAFLNERWRGQHPLLWGTPLIQAELMEAMHCGLFGLELVPDRKEKGFE